MDKQQGARETSQAVRMFSFSGIFAQLTKFKVSLFVALSACAGFVLAGERASGEMFLPALGVLLLSCDACALNQYQERKADAKMERTRRRPLPAGKMAPATALRVSALLAGSGSAALLLSAGWLVWGLGLLAMVWYNGVYLYLKRRFAWAVLPGALVGVILGRCRKPSNFRFLRGGSFARTSSSLSSTICSAFLLPSPAS
jgi:heme O synthase-like polyprenyltransferase